MYVKVLTGRYAGEIQEFQFEVARDLIANGRAERVNYDGSQAAIQEPKAPLPAAAPQSSKHSVKKTRKSR